MRVPRGLALVAAVLLGLLGPDLEARRLPRARKQDAGKPAVISLEPGGDSEELKEKVREERLSGKRVEVRTTPAPLVGPPASRLPGAREPLVTGTGYRPVDTLVTDPAFDGFPSNSHVEPSIAAQDPAVVCAFNDGGTDALSPNPATVTNADGFSISADAGATFRDQGKRAPATGFTSFNGDNVVAAGPDRDFYYFSDGGRNGVTFSAMAVSRSTDGGRTWSVATSPSAGLAHRFSDGFFDKGWIAVDRSGTATRGNVYVTWSDFSFQGGATDLYFSRSTDRGATWSAARRLDSFPHPIAVTYVQVAANGTLYVGEQDEGTLVDGEITGTNYLRVSTDGGATFSSLRSAGSYRAVGDPKALGLCGDPGFFQGLVRYLNGPIEADSSLRIAVDPSDPAGRTVVIATQAVPDDRPGDASDVFVWRTTDGGLTFSQPIRVNDDTTTADQLMPDLWYAPDGSLGILWLDRRNDPQNFRAEAWMAISRDGGKTFGCSFPVSSQAFPVVGRCQMSDYNGVYADAKRFYLAWGDGRQVDPQGQLTSAIYAATVPLEGPGPLLSLDGFSPVTDKTGRVSAVRVRVRNDGHRPATGLTASIAVVNDQLDPPIRLLPFPDVPPCHGVVELVIPTLFAVTDPYASAHLSLQGPEGSVDFPFSFELPVTGLGTLLSTDFETSSSDWTASPGSYWHVTTGCAALDAGHSRSRAAYFGLDTRCDYGSPTSTRVFGGLTSKEIAVPPGAARLRFKEWVGLDGTWSRDYAGLQVSTDGGRSFENVWGYGRMSRTTPDPAVPLVSANGRPSWHDVDLDLSEYAGHGVVLRFFVNAITKSLPGYAVDDVVLTSVSGTPGALGTCAAPQPLDAGEPVTVRVASVVSPLRASDPVPSCANAKASSPFWLELVPASSGPYTITASPCQSGFDISLAVFTGPRCGPYVEARTVDGAPACAAQLCNTFAPVELTVNATAGVPLRILALSTTSDLAGVFTVSVTPKVKTSLVPIVLDVVSGLGAYRTEVALTNRGTTAATATLRYTASIGTREGSGASKVTLPAGRQVLLPDVLAYLRQTGLAIPASGPQGGTLLVTFSSVSSGASVSATARTLSPTAAPYPAGTASLAYGGLSGDGLATTATLFGLRTSDADRSKVAIFSRSDEPVTVRVTVFSGEGDGRSSVIREAETLPPYGWVQLEDVLGELAQASPARDAPSERSGFTSGWVTVERTSSTGTFGAYGIVNDNGTNDGSYVEAATGRSPLGSGLTVPVLVETGRFVSELVLANRSSRTAVLTLSYVESLSPEKGRGGSVRLELGPSRQEILPNALDFLRAKGLALGAKGAADFAGSLRIDISGVPASDVYAAARTTAPVAPPLVGAFGLFTPAVARGDEADAVAYVDGLRADATSRSNVAVVNAGADIDGPVTLSLTAYDGETGVPRGTPLTLTLAPGGWAQPVGFFEGTGVANGYVVVRRVAGAAPWIAYGIVNDGATPGVRTDDGAYVPMRR